MIKLVSITATELIRHDPGTDDILASFPDGTNVLYGDDGGSLLDHAIGGDDTLTAQLVFDALPPTSITFNMFDDAGEDIANHAKGSVTALGITTFQSAEYFGIRSDNPREHDYFQRRQ